VYAASFLKGYAPETILFDAATQFSTECPIDSTSDVAPCYYPGNYDQKFRGPMSLRDALAQSVNIVALKLLYLVGLNDALALARSVGITTLEGPDRYGLTLVLGGGEVTLLELTSAYSVFANEGVRNPYRAILKIEDRGGTAVREYPLSPTQTLPENVALNISDVLSDNVARTPEFGTNSALYIPNHHVAAKTGTTNDYRDAWIIGYSTSIAIGAWAGNNDNSPMEKKIAGFIVAPMWNEFFRYALTKYPDQPFPEAPSLVHEDTKPVLRGIWQGNEVTRVNEFGNPVPDGYNGPSKLRVLVNIHDILHWVNKQDPLGPVPQTPSNDPQYLRWEYGAQRWAAQSGVVNGGYVFINN
jgi:membrane peptidoglycan carboxypeptidase